MKRLLAYIVIILLLGLGFAILDSYNFTIIFDFGHTRWMFSALFAASLLFIILIIIYLLYNLLSQLLLAPGRLKARRKQAKKLQYEAVLSKLIAAYIAADKGHIAKLFTSLRSVADAKNSPSLNKLHRLIYPLAEAANCANCDAIVRYEHLAKAEDLDQKTVGLYKLYQIAMQNGDIAAAHNYCRELFTYNKTIDWVNNNLLGHCVSQQDWAQMQKLAQLIEADSTKNRRNALPFKPVKALLLIAQAQSLWPEQAKQAEALAQKAYALDSKNMNVAILYSKTLFARNETRKASKLCEAAWAEFAHPDLATLYVYGVKDLTAEQRFARAQQLEKLQPGNVYAYFELSRAALRWDRPSAALEYIEKAIAIEPIAQCCAFAKMLSKKLGRNYVAPTMTYDYAWCADGIILSHWQAASPFSKILDAVKWQKIIPVASAPNYGENIEFGNDKPVYFNVETTGLSAADDSAIKS